jgi:hypothetical protein
LPPPAQPAQAAECATTGHVYVTSVSPWSIRYEDKPLNGGTDDYQMFATSATTFQVGGNGLQRYTTPTLFPGYRFIGQTRQGVVYPLDPSDWLAHACSIVQRDLTPAEWAIYLPGRPYRPTCNG